MIADLDFGPGEKGTGRGAHRGDGVIGRDRATGVVLVGLGMRMVGGHGGRAPSRGSEMANNEATEAA